MEVADQDCDSRTWQCEAYNGRKLMSTDGEEQQAIELCTVLGELPLGLNHRTVIVKPTDCKEKEI